MYLMFSFLIFYKLSIMEMDLGDLNIRKQSALREMARHVVDNINTAFIFCFSFQKHKSTYTSCFDKEYSLNCFQADILLIYKDEERRSKNEILQLVNGLSSNACDYVAVAYSFDTVKMLIDEGDFFLSTVFRKGVLLHSEGLVLPDRRKFVSHESLLNKTRGGCIRWLTTSSHFMDCAVYCIMEGHLGIGVFMIHQAIEQICRGLLAVLMQVHHATHNLSWMLKLSSSLAPEIAFLFPRDSPQERALFKILRSSYLDSRYAEKFEVKEQDCWVLYERAVELRRIAGELCEGRIRYLEGCIVPKITIQTPSLTH